MKDRREHSEELNDAPELRKLKGKDPFQVPDSYFEGLESRFQAKLEEEEEEEEMPVLGKLEKKNVFQVPDTYFEGVLKRFEAARDEAEKEESKSAPVISLRATYVMLAVAAAFALLFLILRPQGEEIQLQDELALSELPLEDLLAEVDPASLSEEVLLSTFEGEEFSEWVEEADIEVEEEENLPLGEESIDELIEELDVYSLEEELDDLDFEGLD